MYTVWNQEPIYKLIHNKTMNAWTCLDNKDLYTITCYGTIKISHNLMQTSNISDADIHLTMSWKWYQEMYKTEKNPNTVHIPNSYTSVYNICNKFRIRGCFKKFCPWSLFSLL